MKTEDCISVLLFDVDGRMLLQFRDDTEGIPNQHTWGMFGGQREDESPIACARRELREELQIDFSDDDLELIGSMTKYRGQRYVVRVRVPIAWGQFQVCEGAGAGFFTKKSALRLSLTVGSRSVIEQFA